MFSTWKTDTTSFDTASREQAPRAPQPEPASNAATNRPAASGTGIGAHAKDGFSVINEWLKMRGDLEGDGDILVKGEVYGNVRCKTLVVEHGALVEGGIEADDVVIRGSARGVIRTKRIRLERTAMVDCEIYHQSFSAEEGARVKGMMHAYEDSVPLSATSAPAPAQAAREHEPRALGAALKAAATSHGKAAATPEARVSSAFYDMLDAPRSAMRPSA